MRVLDSSHPIFERGKYIACGCSRSVYRSAHHKDRVVKECDPYDRDNAREAELWKKANRSLRKYLARVYAVSTCGRYLVMQKTRPVGKRAYRKHLIPAHMDYDAHQLNFGRLPDGRIVMHDYPMDYNHQTTAGKSRTIPRCARGN